METRRFALGCAALLLCLAGAAAKVVDGTVALSAQSTESNLAKFSFSAFETAHIKGEFNIEKGVYFDQHPHMLVLCLYDEAQWAKFQQAMSEGSLCRDREKLASWKTARIQPARGGKDARRFSFESQLTAPKKHAHYWFAVLMDCYLEEYDAHPPPMRYQITMTNGASHLPADESGMISINLLTMIAMGAYGFWCAGTAYLHMQKNGQIHLITLIFSAAYLLQLLSVFCELLHLIQYARDGKGLRFRHTVFALDFVSGLAQTMSELILSVLLIALAFGWLKSPSAGLLLGVGGTQVALHLLSHGYDEVSAYAAPT